jgi:hypothetical protein
MDQLAREYRDTHGPEIPEEIFELARRLGDGPLMGRFPNEDSPDVIALWGSVVSDTSPVPLKSSA